QRAGAGAVARRSLGGLQRGCRCRHQKNVGPNGLTSSGLHCPDAMSLQSLTTRIRSNGPLSLLLDSFIRWSAQRASSKGAALALYMIFSLTPILVLLMVLGEWFFSADAIREELLYHVRRIADQRSADAIQGILANVHYERGSTIAAWFSLGM